MSELAQAQVGDGDEVGSGSESFGCALGLLHQAVHGLESLFRTAKYRPEFPEQGFSDLDAARAWATGFVHWYNLEHRHSGIRYVTPAQRHAGQDREILRARHQVYTQARQNNPRRWSGATRDWSHIATVTLNPERTEVVTAAVARGNSRPLAA